ncbi:MAG: sensor domain-containing diguanylate cyclase [Firmicutes bacterium]|nr:sensor domain-containing diguanylate cyclase [Bacillota bacterium]
MTMKQRMADVYLWLVVGLAILGWLALPLGFYPTTHVVTILIGMAMVAVSDIWPLKISRGSIALSTAGYFSVFMIGGLPAASYALLCGLVISTLTRPRGVKSLFNMAQFILSLYGAALVYDAMISHLWLALVAFAVVSIGINHLLVNAYYIILEGSPALADAVPSLLLDGLAWVISAPLIAIFVLLDRAYHWQGAILAFFPFLFVTWLLASAYQTRRAHQNTMAVARVSTGIALAGDRPTIYQLIERALRDIMDVTAIVIYAMGPNPHELVREWIFHPLGENAPYDSTVHPNEGITGWVMETQSPELVPDSFRISDRWVNPGDTYPLRSALMLPMVTEGQLVGMVVVGNVRPNIYDNFDLRLGMIIAGQAAIALRKIDLDHETTRLGRVDPLIPELFNYRHFRNALQSELDYAKMYQRQCAVAFLDMDRFKLVNDQYGHLIGDEVLRQLVAVVRREIRAHDLLARYGGDEFVLLLSDIDVQSVKQVLDRIQDRIGQHQFSGVDFPLGVSVGWALYPEDGETLEHLLNVADQHMYRNKELRRKIHY